MAGHGCEYSYSHYKSYADITKRDSNVTWIKSMNFAGFVPLLGIANGMCMPSSMIINKNQNLPFHCALIEGIC